MIITLTRSRIELNEDLYEMAKIWSLEVTRFNAVQPLQNDSYHLMPEYMLGIHGITCELFEGKWRFSRDHEATSWEDFLLMHLTHQLAAKHASLLQYGEALDASLVEPAPEIFATFAHYADYVTRKETGIMKDIKVKWLYTHRKRFIR
jgi:hypothetical protein